MNTQSIPSGRFGAWHTASAAVILTASFGIVPVSTFADQGAVTPVVSSVADVSLSDLNLSTPEGMRWARDRLHAVAERVCAERGGSREPSSQPTFAVCVDSTLANALRQIEALRRANTTVRNSVTGSANVSLADLDLSTLEGARIASERLEAMARRLCGELARRQGLAYQPSWAACVQDTSAGALAQANVLAAVRNSRTARRSVP